MSGPQPEIADLMKQMRARFGAESIRLASEIPIKKQPSGLFLLDQLLAGGVPVGRIMEMFGPESSGKTSLAMHVAGNFQRVYRPYVGWINFERTFDAARAKTMGMNIDYTLVANPVTGEDGYQQIIDFAKTNLFGLVVMDSITAMMPKMESEADLEKDLPAIQARVNSRLLRRLVQVLDNAGLTLIVINQLRTDITKSYGNPETVPGGRALKHYASVRLSIRQGGLIDEENKEVKWGDREQSVGHLCQIDLAKSKVSIPHRRAGINLLPNGFDVVQDLIDAGVHNEVVERRGAWYYFISSSLEEHKFQGRPNFIEALKENEALRSEISNRLAERIAETATQTENDSPLVEVEVPTS